MRPFPIALLGLLLLAACAQPVKQEDSVVALAKRQAEQDLLAGVRQYEDGDYPEAERLLQQALSEKLTYPKDQVVAYKYLAFIYCGAGRTDECSGAFKKALAIDPKFQLSASEAGHPVWGPLFKSLQAPAR
jgi:Tfp pilus assembly protein PilF